MKKKINSKTYNTETSKKVCSYVVNDWTYELYQSKSGKYFTHYYQYDHCHEELRFVLESEVSHMLERSGVVSGDEKVTVLKGLEPWSYDEENMDLKVTGKGGFVNYDFGSWEVTVDIDDKDWVKVTTKGKTVFNQDDLDLIEEIRGTGWLGKHYLEDVRRKYLNQKYGEC